MKLRSDCCNAAVIKTMRNWFVCAECLNECEAVQPSQPPPRKPYVVDIHYTSKHGSWLTRRGVVMAKDEDAAIEIMEARIKKQKNFGSITGGDCVSQEKVERH